MGKRRQNRWLPNETRCCITSFVRDIGDGRTVQGNGSYGVSCAIAYTGMSTRDCVRTRRYPIYFAVSSKVISCTARIRYRSRPSCEQFLSFPFEPLISSTGQGSLSTQPGKARLCLSSKHRVGQAFRWACRARFAVISFAFCVSEVDSDVGRPDADPVPERDMRQER